jgi:serine/threonine protein kinase
MAVIAGRYETIGEPREEFGSFEFFRARSQVAPIRDVELVRTIPLLPADQERTMSELKTLARASEHPHVAPILDAGLDGEERAAFAVMPALSTSLGDLLPLRSPMPLGVALRIVADAARGYEHVHSLGLVPGRLDVGRIEITETGMVRVRPFPLRKPEMNPAGPRGVGPPPPAVLLYFSPEIVIGKPDLTAASNVFGLCVLAYELTTGENPFRRDHMIETLQAIFRDPVPPPSEKNPGYPRDLEALLMRGLEREPAQRIATCRALFAELDAIAEARKAWVAADEVAAFVRSLGESA